jgi:hypothetical protein
VTLTGNELVGSQPIVVVGHYSTGTGAAFEKTWATMIQAGVEDLVGKIEQRLAPPAAIAGVPSGAAPSLAQVDAGS